MGILATIGTMGMASIGCMIAEKIAIECQKPNLAYYISLFATSSIGTMAVVKAVEFIRIISTM